MEDKDQERADLPVLRVIEADEQIERFVQAEDMTVVVTDRRVAVGSADRVELNVPFEGLRRIQFDVERTRPATLVLVPEHWSDVAQVITVQPGDLEEVAHAVAVVGKRLAALG
jgi:hypothetical protein